MNAINYPFSLDAYGTLQSTSDQGKIWQDRLLTLLSTHIGQRPILTEYGTDFSRALFENENNFGKAVKTAVTTAVGKWMPEVKLITVDIFGVDHDGIASLKVSIQLPNDQVLETTIKSAIFKSDGTITRQAITG